MPELRFLKCDLNYLEKLCDNNKVKILENCQRTSETNAALKYNK